jgi:hypothetical protein
VAEVANIVGVESARTVGNAVVDDFIVPVEENEVSLGGEIESGADLGGDEANIVKRCAGECAGNVIGLLLGGLDEREPYREGSCLWSKGREEREVGRVTGSHAASPATREGCTGGLRE